MDFRAEAGGPQSNSPPTSATRSPIPKQSQACALLGRPHVKAYPVVPHHQVQDLRRPIKFDADRSGARMAPTLVSAP